MQLTVKTVKGQDFKVDAEETAAVSDVKARIEEMMGSAYPKDSLLLIYKGKVLRDDSTLVGNGVEESGFVVVMVSKAKKPSDQAGAPTPGATSSAQPEAQPPQPEAAPSDRNVTTREPAPQAAPEQAAEPMAVDGGAGAAAAEPETAYGAAASTLATGSALEVSVRQICDMGFPKEQVVRALRAAFNNPDRAVEYLMSGIPEAVEAPPQRAAANPQVAQLPPQAAQQQGEAEQTGPNAQPLDMFGGGGGATGGVGQQGGGAAAGRGPLDYLRNNAQFQTLRQMVAQNPQILQPMLQELGKNNPELLQQITGHQEEFLRLLTEDPPSQVAEAAEGLIQLGQGGAAAQMAAPPIEISQEDEAAITRLQGLGFERALCIEAFLICDKNEDLAANYLLEHADDL